MLARPSLLPGLLPGGFQVWDVYAAVPYLHTFRGYLALGRGPRPCAACAECDGSVKHGPGADAGRSVVAIRFRLPPRTGRVGSGLFRDGDHGAACAEVEGAFGRRRRRHADVVQLVHGQDLQLGAGRDDVRGPEFTREVELPIGGDG